MSKSSGMGHRLFIAGKDVSGDIGELGRIGGGPAALDVTSILKSAFERIGGIRDGGLEWKAFFNPGIAADTAHTVFSALPTADVIASYWAGAALGSPAANLVGKQLGYDPKRGQDGALTFDVTAEANGYGLEWCTQLTAGKKTDTAATNGTGVDFGLGSSGTGPSVFGLQAWLHVFSFTGTSVTVKLQESSDNGVGDAWADVTGGAFTAATAVTSQRIETARGQTVKQYLRAVTSGTFSSAVFAVSATRNDTSTVF